MYRAETSARCRTQQHSWLFFSADTTIKFFWVFQLRSYWQMVLTESQYLAQYAPTKTRPKKNGNFAVFYASLSFQRTSGGGKNKKKTENQICGNENVRISYRISHRFEFNKNRWKEWKKATADHEMLTELKKNANLGWWFGKLKLRWRFIYIKADLIFSNMFNRYFEAFFEKSRLIWEKN